MPVLRPFRDDERREVKEMIQIVIESSEVVSTRAGAAAMSKAVNAMEQFLAGGLIELDDEKGDG